MRPDDSYYRLHFDMESDRETKKCDTEGCETVIERGRGFCCRCVAEFESDFRREAGTEDCQR